ncbi:uncharacterized protein B0H18DRAFT_154684 [Fomitopsis serialis]|uniref:uncharacterized protein n=1 Tax=Fomitopsis serialis TaxID=139415 RepID=UPI0020088B82|nr:uncharacterized protein B0H18DRAFT_154684 [Neoantrodia serialis]KAH9913858.1 hypothetical protein B0H18DRAFT_154684 [Neoantrodia serialis]
MGSLLLGAFILRVFARHFCMSFVGAYQVQHEVWLGRRHYLWLRSALVTCMRPPIGSSPGSGGSTRGGLRASRRSSRLPCAKSLAVARQCMLSAGEL